MSVRKKVSNKSEQKDLYFVAVKLLLRDGESLLITHDIFGAWDIPGGRIRKDQFNTPLDLVLAEKVNEELGSDLKYELGGPAATFRVEREEAGLDGRKVRVFAVGYEAEYLGGKIQLGDHHDEYEWINLRKTKLDDYASPGGWVEQLKDYRESLAEHV